MCWGGDQPSCYLPGSIILLPQGLLLAHIVWKLKALTSIHHFVLLNCRRTPFRKHAHAQENTQTGQEVNARTHLPWGQCASPTVWSKLDLLLMHQYEVFFISISNFNYMLLRSYFPLLWDWVAQHQVDNFHFTLWWNDKKRSKIFLECILSSSKCGSLSQVLISITGQRLMLCLFKKMYNSGLQILRKQIVYCWEKNCLLKIIVSIKFFNIKIIV